MRYTGEFNSIDGRAYRIEIVTPTSGVSKKLKLSGTPFVSSVSGEDKMIYSPIRCGGATVGILAEDYIFDFYAGQAKAVKVTLYEETSGGDVVRWTGYVSPTIYDQGYDEYLEEIALDCVDGVAVLKDIPFRTPEREVKTFADIIFYCLKEAGCFKAFYISDNVQLTAGASEPVIEKFRISTSNFYSERKDMAQTDDDLAWKCYDVLAEILRWLGYTLTVEGDEVFIIDYDAIASGLDTYHRYSLEGDGIGAPQYVTKAASKDIKGSDYAQNGTKLSLDEIYNKVTVKDEFKTYDNLFPAFGDENFETNLTADDDPALTADKGGSDYLRFGAVIKSDKANGIYQNFIFMHVFSHRIFDNIETNVVLKLMDSPVFTFHKYERSASRTDITTDSKWNDGNARLSDMLKTNGAFYIRWGYFESNWGLKNPFSDLLQNRATEFDNLDSKGKLEKINSLLKVSANPEKISLSSVIVLLNTGDYRFGPVNEIDYNDRSGREDDITKKYPFVTLKDQTSSSIFGGDNHFLRIKGKIGYHANPEMPVPLSLKGNLSFNKDGDKKYGTQGYIWGKVKWGEQWWDGTEWVKQDTWFKLYYWDPENTPSSWKNKEHYGKEFDIFSNMTSNAVFWGEEGYIIPCPDNGNLNGVPEVSFTTRDMEGDSRRSHWAPAGNKFDNFSCRYFSEVVTIRDLQITAEIFPGLLSDADLDSDTLYTNVMDNGSVSEMSEITFKVCTDDQKKPSYSSVDYLDGSQSHFVTTTFNKALSKKESDTEGFDGIPGQLRQEEHYVFKTASHYESPKVLFECNLHNEDFPMFATFTDSSLGSRKFIITDREVNYRFNSVNLKISEKD